MASYLLTSLPFPPLWKKGCSISQSERGQVLSEAVCALAHRDLRLVRVGEVRLQLVLKQLSNMWRQLCPGLTFLTPLLSLSLTPWNTVAPTLEGSTVQALFHFYEWERKTLWYFCSCSFLQTFSYLKQYFKRKISETHWKLETYPAWKSIFTFEERLSKS